jgi:flagellar hook-associated protein 1 FlgK
MGISSFLGLQTTLRGILAQQRAIDVTGHNIANASTVGYTRQRADLVTTPAFTDTPAGQLGTGVDVQGYRRMVDDFIDTSFVRGRCAVRVGAAGRAQPGRAR